MNLERSSHSWCTLCDIAFIASIVCPRCHMTSNVVMPPRGSPPPPTRSTGRRGAWLGKQPPPGPS